jgi:hypothetical protein
MITNKNKNLTHILVKNIYYSLLECDPLIYEKLHIEENTNRIFYILVKILNNMLTNELIKNEFDAKFRILIRIIMSKEDIYRLAINIEYYNYEEYSIYITFDEIVLNIYKHTSRIINLIKFLYKTKNYNDITITLVKHDYPISFELDYINLNMFSDRIDINFYDIFDYNKIEEYLLNNDIR